MTAALGLVGVGLFYLAYDAVDKSGLRMALFGAAAIACFGVMIVGTPKNTGDFGCYTEWDARSNQDFCD